MDSFPQWWFAVAVRSGVGEILPFLIQLCSGSKFWKKCAESKRFYVGNFVINVCVGSYERTIRFDGWDLDFYLNFN